MALRPRLLPGVPLSWMCLNADSVRSGTGTVKRSCSCIRPPPPRSSLERESLPGDKPRRWTNC